jgi:hypothetical protein
VPNLRNKTPEAPSAELNPLMNPILEKNLGRWAKVYFSTPPANREQAVSNLLEQIKRESGAATATQPGRPYFSTDPKFQRGLCAICQHHNPPGHKFCSRCGQTLNQEPPASQENRVTSETPNVPQPRSANEVQWMREQTFSGLTDAYAPRKRGWKYAVGAVVIVLAGFAYMRWSPDFWTKISATRAPQVSTPATASRPQKASPAEVPVEAPFEVPVEAKDEVKVPAEPAAKSVVPEPIAPKFVAPENVAPRNNEHEVEHRSANAEAGHRPVQPVGVQSAAQKLPLPDASRQTVVDQGSDASDLRLAQRYLGGSMGVRDPAEAAKLLWRAVSKQNATAAVLLSDLYLRGDGVPRSCDQARLLLVAAAKRGSPLAAQQLRNLESQGCR